MFAGERSVETDLDGRFELVDGPAATGRAAVVPLAHPELASRELPIDLGGARAHDLGELALVEGGV